MEQAWLKDDQPTVVSLSVAHSTVLAGDYS